MRPSIQIYGQFGDFWSNACVSRGIASAFVSRKWETMIHDRNGQYDGMWFNAVCGMDDATYGLYVGYAVRATELLAYHPIKIGAFIAESSIVPPDWALCANACDLVIVPSRWTAQAYIRGGTDPRKVRIAHHGLHPCFGAAPKHGGLGGVYLHVAGARDFIERKGTPQLIEAWRQLPDTVGNLVIRTPPSPKLQALAADLVGRVCFDFHDRPMRPEEMRDYLLNGPHGTWAAVIQPSRAEAFGLVPCEARACGIPVIMTACGGHEEHARPDDVTFIAHGVDAPLAVNGIPNGMAPTVTPAAIVDAMKGFLYHRDTYTKNARALGAGGYGAQWNWAALWHEVIEEMTPARKRRL